MKGYIAWNYWDRKILLRTTSWQEADAAVKDALKKNINADPNWFGVEAVEDINSGPNKPRKKNPVRDPAHEKLVSDEYAQRRANETRRNYAVSNMGHALLAVKENLSLMEKDLGGIKKIYRPIRKKNPQRLRSLPGSINEDAAGGHCG